MLSELLLEFDAIACSESVQMAGEQEKVQGKVQAQRRAPEKTVSVDARSGIARSSFKIGRERLDKEEDEGRNRGTLEVLERGRAAGFEDTPRTEHRAIQSTSSQRRQAIQFHSNLILLSLTPRG